MSTATFVLLALIGDGGELAIGTSGGLSLQHLTYQPGAGTSARDGLTVGGRVGGFVRYGLSDTLHLGVGFEYVIAPNPSFEDTVLGPYTGLLYADVTHFVVPVTASLLVSWGYDWSLLLSAHGGLSLQKWDEVALVDPSSPDADGQYPQYPAAVGPQSYTGAVVGLSIAADWRILDWLVADIGPRFELIQAPAGNWHWTLDVAVQVSYVFGLGPSWAF